MESNTNKREHIKQIARTTKRRLILLISILLAIILVLRFSVGEALWPIWMMEHRTRIMGIFLLVETFLILLSPVIVEVNSNPRHLSGPGDRPSGYG
jgi:hypothetical protein